MRVLYTCGQRASLGQRMLGNNVVFFHSRFSTTLDYFFHSSSLRSMENKFQIQNIENDIDEQKWTVLAGNN